jgi:hypothetical protein
VEVPSVDPDGRGAEPPGSSKPPGRRHGVCRPFSRLLRAVASTITDPRRWTCSGEIGCGGLAVAGEHRLVDVAVVDFGGPSSGKCSQEQLVRDHGAAVTTSASLAYCGLLRPPSLITALDRPTRGRVPVDLRRLEAALGGDGLI